jgi:DNA-binding transcriptional regulator LsrR (DeoR family)
MYQIEIYRKQYDQPVDMDAVIAALGDLMTEDQMTNDGTLAREHEKVYVRFGCVGIAVDAINALGYATDEDELDSSDRDNGLDEIGFDVERADK